ncbi:hypothetical protein [Legionella santicrucis]|nr:hypothetical protein [Legionella santicrucis]
MKKIIYHVCSFLCFSSYTANQLLDLTHPFDKNTIYGRVLP